MAQNQNKPKQEQQTFDDSRIDRVMSAPPQQSGEAMDICSEVAGQEKLLETMMNELNVPSVPECDSDDEIRLSEFDRFMQIEKLIKKFSPIDPERLKSLVLNACRLEKRTPLDINFFFARGEDVYMEKIKSLKNKTDTSIEKVRTEFNRVTSENLPNVMQNLVEINVKKISEMKEIAGFVFEKVVSDPVFFEVYMKLIHKLSKEWTCEEEKKMEKSGQTCFFGTLLTLGMRLFESNHSWFAQVDEGSITATGGSMEDQIEEKFAKKSMKRLYALGTVNFFAYLYINNTVGPQTILKIIKTLTATKTPENVVMVCHVFKPLVEKFMRVDREENAKKLAEYLKSQSKCGDLRLEVEIERALGSVSAVAQLLRGPKQKENTFSSFAVEEEVQVTTKRSDDEILQEYVFHISGVLDSITDEEDILSFGDTVFREIDRYNNQAFFINFIIETISNRAVAEKMMRILMARLIPKALDLPGVLGTVKNELGMLRLEFPCSAKNYSMLLCQLRGDDMVTMKAFEELRLEEFVKHAGVLLRGWKESGDARLGRVLGEEELKQL